MAQDLYDTDFFQWTQDTARKIRDSRFEEIDLNALAEEIEDLGKRDLHGVNSRVRVIILHLLKLRYQPERRSSSWLSSIVRERGNLEDIFEQSPSLRVKSRNSLPRTYARAVREALAETNLPASAFPAECPWTYEQILDPDFYPEVR